MNLRDLEYLIAVDEELHFNKAASRCFVSQPTLSGQIKKLEEELGVLLIERTNRRVIMTDVGKAVANQARRILAEARSL
ncbi:MAG: LysR family transcriptional regulator, partial [Gammaproteobacteria bacterium]|nr:LysR family transcriptional regulator [Gammaproteobacteria bacterium]